MSNRRQSISSTVDLDLVEEQGTESLPPVSTPNENKEVPVIVTSEEKNTIPTIPSRKIKLPAIKIKKPIKEEKEKEEEEEEEEQVEVEPKRPLTPLEIHNQIISGTRWGFFAMCLGHFGQTLLICGTASQITPTPGFLIGVLVASFCLFTVQIGWAFMQFEQFQLWDQDQYNRPEGKKIQEILRACKQLGMLPFIMFMLNLFTLLLVLGIISYSFRTIFNGECPKIPSDNFPILTDAGKAFFVLYILVFVFHGMGVARLIYMNHEMVNAMKKVYDHYKRGHGTAAAALSQV